MAREAGETLATVSRAVTMLEMLGTSGPLNLSQIADRMDIGKATASRMLQTLVARDWVVRSADRTYRLGPGILGLAMAKAPQQHLIGDLRPILDALHDTTGETIHLTRLDGRYVVYVEQIVSQLPVRSAAVIGARSPAHCVSPGLAQLSHLPAEQLAWFLSTPLKRYTPASTTNPEELRRKLETVRERGYAVNLGGFRPDVGGVGAAVVDHGGQLVAGISVCAPVYRLATMDLDALGVLVRDAASEASRLLDKATSPHG